MARQHSRGFSHSVSAIAAAFLLSIISSNSGAAEPANLDKIPTILGPGAIVYTPQFEYPNRAKRFRLTGKGIGVLNVDSRTGRVTEVQMARSTGEDCLDRAALQGFRQMRFRPGTPRQVKIPITFSLLYGGQPQLAVEKKDMDKVLAAFLGKGTVKKGPIPAYPRYPKWTTKSGKGVYELHADPNGKILQVKILKSSGDAIFDREAVKTLGKWRLARGPLVLELPLRFQLTPTNYSVDVGR